MVPAIGLGPQLVFPACCYLLHVTSHMSHCDDIQGNSNIQSDEFSTAFNTDRELKDGTDFLEVTMAYEDRQQMGAHKVILSPSSPLFRDIWRHHRHSHPMIALRGIKPMGVEWTFLRSWGLHCRNKESGTGLLQPVEIFPTYRDLQLPQVRPLSS